MTQEERDNILLNLLSMAKEHSTILKEHTTRFEAIDKQLEEHSAILKEHTTRFEAIDKQLEEHSTILKEHTTRFEAIDKQLEEHSAILKEHTREIASISGSVAVIEQEHEHKIQAAFDGYKLALEKLHSHDNRFESQEELLNNHGDRIFCLESKVSNL